jgi:hypothetical protein
MSKRIKAADFPDCDAARYLNNERAMAAYLTDILQANDCAGDGLSLQIFSDAKASYHGRPFNLCRSRSEGLLSQGAHSLCALASRPPTPLSGGMTAF